MRLSDAGLSVHGYGHGDAGVTVARGRAGVTVAGGRAAAVAQPVG